MKFMKRLGVAFIVLILASAGISGPVQTDACFENLPAGCFVKNSFMASKEQIAPIAAKLGAEVSGLSNTQLVLHGASAQVNLIDAATEADAKRIHDAIARTKPDPAFCLRRGSRVIEYVAADVAVAKKASYELGFVAKPTQVRYRVTARLATVDTADYMVLNRLFNRLMEAENPSPREGLASEISSLASRLEFGKKIVLRRGPDEQAATYTFSPAAEKMQLAAEGESATYFFQNLPQVQGIPHVTLTAEIRANETGLTPTKRKADATLLQATAFWPVDDPEIASLAKKITEGQDSPEAKVQAILEWLTPNRNIRFGGPVTGSRYGVKQVLKQRYGHCWDFADCFVTLCRAVDVPCREVGGWFYGVSGHVWAEVLLEGEGWQQVDPTGGGALTCGIYHIPYFATEDGEMPILYTAMPRIEIVETE